MTFSTTLTDTQITTLEQEAALGGDERTASACRRASAGSHHARQVVARIIRAWERDGRRAAEAAIEESRHRDMIVTLAPQGDVQTDAMCRVLERRSVDSATYTDQDGVETHEYWGGRESRDAWRVHVRLGREAVS